MANDKLTFTVKPKVLLILPQGTTRDAEIIRLEAVTPTEKDKAMKELAAKLANHHIRNIQGHRDVETYTNLYGASGNLDVGKINALLNSRGPKDFDDTLPFANRDDFDPMMEMSLTRLRDEIAKRKNLPNNAKRRSFRIQPDPEKKDHADCLFVPDQIKGLTAAMTSFAKRKNTTTNTDCLVPPEDAQIWEAGFDDGITLRQKMEIIANAAKRDRIIYHEPHHDLTPGMLLIDEIFRALVEEVAVMIQAINPAAPTDPEPNLGSLLAYVSGLETGLGASGKFGTYILRGGDHTCPLPEHNQASYHVDPSRIELFLDGGRIRALSVIVGAWAGGTHSAGHTSK